MPASLPFNSDEIWAELKNLEVYKNGAVILKDINLLFNTNQNILVLGPNGSGKTTLIELLNRSIYPIVKNDSYIKLFGKTEIDLFDIRNRIGFLLSDMSDRISPGMTVKEVVISGLYGSFTSSNPVKLGKDQSLFINNLIEELSLTKIQDSYFHQTSDGQKRLALIARSLVHKPKVLILDEPTINLDIKATVIILKILSKLCRNGVKLIYITHNIDFILEEIDKVVFVKNGRIIDQGLKKDLITTKKLSDLFDVDIKVSYLDGIFKVYPIFN